MSVVEVELIGFMVIFVEEDDSLGCEVVDADNLGSLDEVWNTSRTGRCCL